MQLIDVIRQYTNFYQQQHNLMGMQAKFLQQFYSQLFDQQLKKCTWDEPLFSYTDIIVNVCRRIKFVFNNSRLAIQNLCCYFLNKFICNQLSLPTNPQHQFVRTLRGQQNYIVYFTQISIRVILLGYYCKLGQENKRKQWLIMLKQFIKQARINFMINCSSSLAESIVIVLHKIQDLCNQLTFYEKIIVLFNKFDLGYVSQTAKQRILKIKQNLKQQIKQKKVETTPIIQQKSSSKDNNSKNLNSETQKTKNARKSVKIILDSQKISTDQSLKRRITNYREHERKRFSQHLESRKKRTLFHSRKYMIKISRNSQQFGSDQQSVLMDEFEQQQKQPEQAKSNQNMTNEPSCDQNLTNINSTYPKVNRYQKLQMQIKSTIKQSQKNEQDSYMVPGTPPKSKKQFSTAG